jgi:5-methylcytosine-specific restriction endonuclease McrA
MNKGQRRRAYAKTHGLCWYCGDKADTIDHFLPLDKCGNKNDILRGVRVNERSTEGKDSSRSRKSERTD